jgi:hypothetical protein
MDHRWVLDQVLIILFKVILIKVHLHLVMDNKDPGMDQDPMVLQVLLGVHLDLEDHLPHNRDHLDLVLVKADLLECSMAPMEDHQGLLVREYHVDLLVILVDPREVILGQHRPALVNGIDHQVRKQDNIGATLYCNTDTRARHGGSLTPDHSLTFLFLFKPIYIINYPLL